MKALASLGDLLDDTVVWLDGPPARGTDVGCRIFHRRGGSAANVAAHGARLGGTWRFLGRVGDDDAGRGLVASLTAANVDVRVERSGRTGTVVVLVGPDGERTMLSDRGAATELADVPDEWLEGIAALHVPAYSLVIEPLAAASCNAIGRAGRCGAMVSIDASSVSVLEAFGSARFGDLVDGLRPDVLLANAEEAAVLGWPDSITLAHALVVVKDGPRPALVSRGGLRTLVPVCSGGEQPEGREVRDTTGAGDAFAAGLMNALVAGITDVAAVERAHEAAAAVLGSPGAQVLA